MTNPLNAFRLKFSPAYTFWTAALAPLGVALFLGTTEQDLGLDLVALVAAGAAVFAFVTYRGRRLAGWAAAMTMWLLRRRRPAEVPSQPVVGATVHPGDDVALRWEGGRLVALIKLLPRPFTPTFVVDGRARTEDTLDTSLLEQLLSANCPDLEADVVSAGHRVSGSATNAARSLYAELIGRDPAPAYRRTWVMLRADPQAAERSALRREADVPGLARYLVASATRIADQLAGHGVDAWCESSFDDYDNATAISFEHEQWSTIKGHGDYTAAYTAAGGPDAWWSAPADRTITRMRIAAGMPPRSAVLLTSTHKPKRPAGFSRTSGGQRDPLGVRILTVDRHRRLPIGSAGVLVGETADKHRIYLSFDDSDASVTAGNAGVFSQFAARAAAAGGIVALPPEFGKLAALIGGEIGPEPKVAWPDATTYFELRPGIKNVVLQGDVVSIPGYPMLRIEQVTADDEERFRQALPGRGRGAAGAGRSVPDPKSNGQPKVPNGNRPRHSL